MSLTTQITLKSTITKSPILLVVLVYLLVGAAIFRREFFAMNFLPTVMLLLCGSALIWCGYLVVVSLLEGQRIIESVAAVLLATPITLGFVAVLFDDGVAIDRVDNSPSNDIRVLINAAELFYSRNSAYPETLRELAEARYIPRVPKDAWGVTYNYSLEKPKLATTSGPFYIWTLGADNLPGGDGGDADFGSWLLGE